MKKLLLVIFIFPVLLYGQDSTFTKVYYDGTMPQQMIVMSMIKANDTGFMMTGLAGEGAFLMKIADTGDILWKKSFPEIFYGRKIKSTSDLGYILAGNKSWNTQFCMKLTNSGDTVWTKEIITGDESGYLNAIAETPANEIVIASETGPKINLTKLSQSGDLIWSEIFDLTGDVNVNSLKIMNDGKILLCGSSDSRPFFSAINNDGTIAWVKIAPSALPFQGDVLDAVITGNDIFLLISNYYNGFYIVKCDLTGIPSISWKLNTWSGWYFAGDIPLPELHIGAEGDLYFVTGGQGGTFVKMDTAGNVMMVDWTEIENVDVIESGDKFLIYGNGPLIGVKELAHPPQAGLLTIDSMGYSKGCAFISSLISEPANFQFTDTVCTPETVVTQVNPLHPELTDFEVVIRPGCVDFSGGVNEKDQDKLMLQISPNPATDRITISIENFKGNSIDFSLYDMMGKLVKIVQINSSETVINTSGLSRGIYFWKAGDQAGKLVICN